MNLIEEILTKQAASRKNVFADIANTVRERFQDLVNFNKRPKILIEPTLKRPTLDSSGKPRIGGVLVDKFDLGQPRLSKETLDYIRRRVNRGK